MSCEYCQDTGYTDVLNVWSVQRTVIEYGDWSCDSAEALPMIKNTVRCHKCHGVEAAESDMKALIKKMGGSPWEEKTFENMG